MARLRSLFAPEIIQTSSMDCGPAALASLLRGHGIASSYGALREVCRTEVDGTSIDALEDVAQRLGLPTEQCIVPIDHVLRRSARMFPAIAVVTRPGAGVHFVVVWRRFRRVLQLMDPAVGRRWMGDARFLEELYIHRTMIDSEAWRAWAGQEEFVGPLRERLAEVGLGRRDDSLSRALAEPRWTALASLDAATRFTASAIRSGAVRRGAASRALVRTLFARAWHELEQGDAHLSIPLLQWSAFRAPPAPDGSDRVWMRGAVLLRVVGAPQSPAADVAPESATALPEMLETSQPRPLRELLGWLGADGALAPTALAFALAAMAFGVGLEAVLLRGVLDIGQRLALFGQRIAGASALGLFALIILVLRLPSSALWQRAGRRLEIHLRAALLARVPRLTPRYFQSRPISDIAERAHVIHNVRGVPALGAQLVDAALGIVFCAAGIAWLDPRLALVALAFAALSTAAACALQPLILERDLRLRQLNGSLVAYYLDALLGLVAVDAQSAHASVRGQHAALLGDWAQAGLARHRGVVAAEGLQRTVGSLGAIALTATFVRYGGDPRSLLMVLYWALGVIQYAEQLGEGLRQYPIARNAFLRVLEPLKAPTDDDAPVSTAVEPYAAAAGSPNGLAIAFDSVGVLANGQAILHDVSLTIAPGECVAIVGPSGAGKSTLLGVLLGLYVPAAGGVAIDGEPLDAARTVALRREIAWVDPTVQLWNRSLLDNLRYGFDSWELARAGAVVSAAEIGSILGKLPDGMQTVLGEGGGLLSGGEGQRVRVGRAMLRDDARLVVLDEPFRGVDPARRRRLLARVREAWPHATILCVSHEIHETQAFDRVVVIEDGTVVEQGRPVVLAAEETSRYRALLDAELAVRSALLGGEGWRRVHLDEGVIDSDPRTGPAG